MFRSALISSDAFFSKEGNSPKISLFESYVSAGFPSPASDYMENALDLNELLIKNPPATFFARISDPNLQGLGLYPNDLIIVDRSLKPSSESLVLLVINGELKIKKFLKEVSSNARDVCQLSSSLQTLRDPSPFEVWGVITYVIHRL